MGGVPNYVMLRKNEIDNRIDCEQTNEQNISIDTERCDCPTFSRNESELWWSACTLDGTQSEI